MPAYCIFIREKTLDVEELKTYGQLAGPTIAAFRARPLVAYGAVEVLEGPEVEGVVVVEFDSMEDARAWYNSADYQAAIQHRFKGASYRAMIVQGV